MSERAVVCEAKLRGKPRTSFLYALVLRRGRARELAGAGAAAAARTGISTVACSGACLMYTVNRQYLRGCQRQARETL